MIWVVPLVFALVAVLGSIAYAVVHGWRLWRVSREVGRRAQAALEYVSSSAAGAERRAAGLSEKGERLQAASDRLQQSLAELAVIREAASEPQALFATLRGLSPRR